MLTPAPPVPHRFPHPRADASFSFALISFFPFILAPQRRTVSTLVYLFLFHAFDVVNPQLYLLIGFYLRLRVQISKRLPTEYCWECFVGLEWCANVLFRFIYAS